MLMHKKERKFKFLFDLRTLSLLGLSFMVIVTKMVQKEFLRTPENETLSTGKVVDILTTAAMDTTTHGIVHMVKRENRCVKALWFVCLVISAGWMTYMIYLTMDNYLSWETVVKTEYISEIPTKFPTISFCNANPFMTPYSDALVHRVMNDSGLTEQNYFNVHFSYALLQFRYIIGLNILSNHIPAQVKPLFGLQLNEMLIDCNYNLQPCTADDFSWFFDPLYGNCYSFNSGRNSTGHEIPDKISTKGGLVNAFEMELYVGNPTDPFTVSVTNGIHLQVHNKTDRPFFYKGQQIPVGTQAHVMITRDFTYRLGMPYSECINDIDPSTSLFVETIFNTSYAYHQTDCFNVCFQRYLLEQCGCYDLTYPIWRGNMTPCLTFNQVYCDGQAQSSFFSQDVKSICGNECPLECNSITYTTALSVNNFPSEAYAKVASNNVKIRERFANRTNITYDELRRNLLSVFVYYDDLVYKSYVETAKMNIADLISNIGGTMGLFLGVSFLSFIELVDVVIHIICLYMQLKTNQVASK